MGVQPVCTRWLCFWCWRACSHSAQLSSKSTAHDLWQALYSRKCALHAMCRPKAASGKAATSGAATPAAAALASEGKGKGRSGGAKKRPPVDAGISKKIESDDKEVEKVIAKMLNMVSKVCNRSFACCADRCMSAECKTGKPSQVWCRNKL